VIGLAKTPRICRLAWDYPAGGKSTYGLQPVIVNLSREQVRQGYEVHVIAPVQENSPREEEDGGVKIHRVEAPFSLSAYRKMGELMVGDPREWVVHTHATSGFFLAPLKYLRAYRVFAQVHGTSKRRLVTNSGAKKGYELRNSLEPVIRLAREKLAWSSADRVLSICNFVSGDLERYYGIKPSSIRTVYNGVDEKVFRLLERPEPPFAGLSDKKIVLYVGHFGVRKGVIHIIRAMKYVKEEVRDAHLLCIGGLPNWLRETGYWEWLLHEVESNGLSESVTMMDAVPNQALVNAYSCASVFVLPSYQEALPKVVLEAMSCSKPVVGTNQGGVPEMVENGKNGVLVKHGDVSNLARAVVSLLKDEKYARIMGRAGRARVEEMFTWTKVVERIRGAYIEA
jgi:glycosyltransferase involved in cell wall biosynthesis